MLRVTDLARYGTEPLECSTQRLKAELALAKPIGLRDGAPLVHAGVTTGTIELEFLGLVEIRRLIQLSIHTQINELSSIYCFS